MPSQCGRNLVIKKREFLLLVLNIHISDERDANYLTKNLLSTQCSNTSLYIRMAISDHEVALVLFNFECFALVQ